MMTKKLIMMCAMAMMVGTTYSQSAAELAQKQAELNKTLRERLIDVKPTKDAKKEAKKLEKEGWTVPAGSKSIAQQISESQFYREEKMINEVGVDVKRFIVQSGIQQSGTFNAGQAAARLNAMAELAASIETKLTAVIDYEISTGEKSALEFASFEKYKQRLKGVVNDVRLTNTIPVLAIYRRMPNGTFEVQVNVAFDKMELMSRMRESLLRELGQKDGEQIYSSAKNKIENEF